MQFADIKKLWIMISKTKENQRRDKYTVTVLLGLAIA